uniref:SJCHGC06079 protein n=1 Tax=Schistosoma japonicum TaxID=6182 RepID=Q5DHI7_SCHJA|nr:SJCHGC06079 protein [Schistosoma japonicum]
MLYYVKIFLVARPPLALFSLFLLLCAVGLIVLDIQVNKSPPNDPDVEKHWNKLLLELSRLEFCFTNSSSVRLMAESYEGARVLRGLDTISDAVVISHAIDLSLVIYPSQGFIYNMPYLLTAKMHGRHIGIKGPLALQKLNISFVVPPVQNDGLDKKEPNFWPIHLQACVTFTATPAIFPPILLPPTCKPNILDGISSQISLLEWSKRADVFGSNRCYGRTRIQTEFHVSPRVLPRLKEY